MRTREIIIISILATISLIRFFFFIPKPESIYTQNINKNILVTGIITDMPDVRLKDQRLIFKPQNSQTNILVVIPKDIDISYGDEIQVQGILEEPENFVTKQERVFNYKRYLANKDIYFIVNYPQIKVNSHDNGLFIKKVLFKIKTSFMWQMNNVLKNPESVLANGLLLGSRGGFTKEQNDQFINTGTIHITALSGYNISIVASSLFYIFSIFLSVSFATVGALLSILLFIIMSGASATSVRAGIMASILFLGTLTGRKYDAKRALVVALLIMVAYDVRVLTDISFQLSFIATFGLIFITPKITPLLSFLPNVFKLKELVATTLACTIACLPILLYATGVLSFVSIPANIFVLPLVPLSMLLSFIASLLSYIYLPLGIIFGFMAYVPLHFIFKIIDFFANIPFASTVVPSFNINFMIIAYIWILYWVFNSKEKK